jgi:hypothetical protein
VLGAKRLLLVLDNYEHVIDAAASMAEALLRANPTWCRHLRCRPGQVPVAFLGVDLSAKPRTSRSASEPEVNHRDRLCSP